MTWLFRVTKPRYWQSIYRHKLGEKLFVAEAYIENQFDFPGTIFTNPIDCFAHAE